MRGDWGGGWVAGPMSTAVCHLVAAAGKHNFSVANRFFLPLKMVVTSTFIAL
jgi:hypothetical protein